MFEYRVEKLLVNRAQARMNELAREGWRVVSVTPNLARGYGLVVVLERPLR